MSGNVIAAIIGVLAALVLAVHSLKGQSVEPRQAMRIGLIWIVIFVGLFLIVSWFVDA